MDVKKENTFHVEGDKHNAISSSIRTERPGNFLFKIESFSLLLGDKCDSCHFEVGGYKWMLSVYPNGDKKRGGDGYISLYLALADPKSLPQGEDVHVLFQLFVFNFLHDSYLVLQDLKDRRFHALMTEKGFVKLLPLKIFKDPSQGYLVDDCCVFGVEMFFHHEENIVGSSLTVKNNLRTDESTFTWKIDKFSTLPKKHISDMFTVGGCKWKLLVHPEGDYRAKGKSLSLFLDVHDHSSFPRGWKIYADFKLSILDQLSQKHQERTVNDVWFSADKLGWGFPEFMKLSDLNCGSKGTDKLGWGFFEFMKLGDDLNCESRGFLVEDTVVIEVKFVKICVVNSLPKIPTFAEPMTR